MAKDHSDNERERNPPLPFHGLLFSDWQQGIFYKHSRLNRVHTTTHVTPIIGLWMGPPRGIDSMTTMMIRKEMFYLTMHSTHFIYCCMASHIW